MVSSDISAPSGSKPHALSARVQAIRKLDVLARIGNEGLGLRGGFLPLVTSIGRLGLVLHRLKVRQLFWHLQGIVQRKRSDRFGSKRELPSSGLMSASAGSGHNGVHPV